MFSAYSMPVFENVNACEKTWKIAHYAEIQFRVQLKSYQLHLISRARISHCVLPGSRLSLSLSLSFIIP